MMGRPTNVLWRPEAAADIVSIFALFSAHFQVPTVKRVLRHYTLLLLMLRQLQHEGVDGYCRRRRLRVKSWRFLDGGVLQHTGVVNVQEFVDHHLFTNDEIRK